MGGPMNRPAPRRLLRLDSGAGALRFADIDARLRADLAEWMRTEADALPPRLRAEITAALAASTETTGGRE